LLEIRRVRSHEADALRRLRLAALTDAPRAFAATVAQEAERPEREWRDLAARSEQGDTVVVCVAIDDGRWVGMAAGRWFARERGIAQLWGMWVAPACRRQGIGERLVSAVRAWAAGHGARFLRLGLIEELPELATFYERLGFAATGETIPLPREPSLTAIFLARPV
jgi:GNAT superfamily N-acetyltransferase